MVYNYTFIFTNMSMQPKNVIKFYCKRGTMENFIKEGKNGFGMAKIIHTKFMANANRLF